MGRSLRRAFASPREIGWDLAPRDGLLAEYRFDEGQGAIVRNRAGSGTLDIDLSAPTSQTYAWNAQGVTVTAGLIQTPTINSSRTVVFLYKTNRDEASGFISSGGPGGSGSGWLADSVVNTETNHIAQNGVAAVKFRASNGTGAARLVRGHFALGFREFASSSNTIHGFGGRHSTTTSRCASFTLAAAWVYSSQLSSAEREQIYLAARKIAVSRGFYIDWRDCPRVGNMVILQGESNADGRALISDLSGGDQARSLVRTGISTSSGTTTTYPPSSTLILGTNQTQTSVATQFGPEIGIAWQRADEAAPNQTLISKNGKGTTYLAPSSAGPTAANSWHVDELPAAGLFWFAAKTHWDAESYWLSQGIGPRLAAVVFLIGLNDATNTSYTTDAATYQAYLQSYYDAIKTYLNAGQDFKLILVRPHSSDPSSNATALGHVRTAMADFVTANPHCHMLDADGYDLNVDNVHWSGDATTGLPKMGEDIADLISWL